MTTMMDGHIAVDEQGIARVAGSRIKVTHLVMMRLHHGLTPEDLAKELPPLTLAEVHAALAYYYDHQADLDRQIARSLDEADGARSDAAASPFAIRMQKEGKLP